MLIAVIILSWLLFVSLIINFIYIANDGISKKDIVGLLLMIFFPPYIITWFIVNIIDQVKVVRARKRLKREEEEENA